jgi:hypothetical protein
VTWDIATWVIVIVALLAFVAAFADFSDAPPGSERRQRAKESIKYDIPIAWRYALLVLVALYSFRFWRRGLMTQFDVSDVWSWPFAITGLLALVALTGTALAMPRVRWWWLTLIWMGAAGGVWFFVWVVSHGGFVPMDQR